MSPSCSRGVRKLSASEAELGNGRRCRFQLRRGELAAPRDLVLAPHTGDTRLLSTLLRPEQRVSPWHRRTAHDNCERGLGAIRSTWQGAAASRTTIPPGWNRAGHCSLRCRDNTSSPGRDRESSSYAGPWLHHR